MTTNVSKRDFRESERGQVLVLFLLIMVTMILIGMVAVAVGQVTVRRQQAQMIVDAAAFAGAAKQAEGMNTIAHLNQSEYNFLNWICYSKLAPYDDNDDTTWERLGAGLLTPIAAFHVNDWAGDLLTDYQDIFTVYNKAIDVVNCLYSIISPIGPRSAAQDVINDNFGDESEKIFRQADLGSSGIADLTAYASLRMVKLTEPEDYEIGPYYYTPWPSNTVCDAWPFGTAYCAGIYAGVAGYIQIYRRWIDPIKYQLGKFYDNDKGSDVRFAYYLTVSQSPVIFGRTFFNDIPPITVAAAAKPYGGYLGKKFTDSFVGFSQESGSEIAETYKAKLVPLTTTEIAGVALQNNPTSDIARWNPLAIQH